MQNPSGYSNTVSSPVVSAPNSNCKPTLTNYYTTDNVSMQNPSGCSNTSSSPVVSIPNSNCKPT